MSSKKTEVEMNGEAFVEGYPGPPPPVHVQPGSNQGYVIQSPPGYTQAVQYNQGMGGPAVHVTTARTPPKDYMTHAVLVTLCCFFPTGILAIMKASEARAAASYGDMQTAERHNKSARQMIKISFIVGLICELALLAFVIFIYMYIFSNVK